MTKKIIYIIYTLILWGTTLGFAQGAKGNGGDQTTATRLLQAGDKFYDQRLYTASMKSYLDGLRIAEHQGYSELTARFYNGMGNLYSTQGDYQMGLYFYRKALSSSRKTGQKTLQNAVLNNLVGASCFVGQADSGMVFLQQMEANVEHNSGYRYNILMGRGLVAKSQDQPAAAASYYIQARQYAIAREWTPHLWTTPTPVSPSSIWTPIVSTPPSCCSRKTRSGPAAPITMSFWPRRCISSHKPTTRRATPRGPRPAAWSMPT